MAIHFMKCVNRQFMEPNTPNIVNQDSDLDSTKIWHFVPHLDVSQSRLADSYVHAELNKGVNLLRDRCA